MEMGKAERTQKNNNKKQQITGGANEQDLFAQNVRLKSGRKSHFCGTPSPTESQKSPETQI
jgi:hypothetical protein